jgi:hypothetical protein
MSSPVSLDGLFQVVIRRPTGIISFKLQLENPLKGFISNRYSVRCGDIETEKSNVIGQSEVSQSFESILESHSRSSVRNRY